MSARPATVLLFLSVLILSACGGGGGGSAGSDPIGGIPYSGVTTAAAITPVNAEALVMDAFSGGESGYVTGVLRAQDSKAAMTTASAGRDRLAALARLAERAAYGVDENPSPGGPARLAARSDTQTIYGSYGGSLSYTVTIDDVSGAARGTYDYQDYNDDNTMAVTGRVTLSGRFDVTSYPPVLVRMDMSFTLLTFVSPGGSTSYSGRVSMTTESGRETMTLNVHMRNDATNRVCWMDGYTTVSTAGSDGSGTYEDVTLSGRYYDPDSGYVVLSSGPPVRTYLSASRPSQGVFTATGQGGGSVRLTFLGPNAYRVDADTDHDGICDDWSSGSRHWSGANAAPVANAGPDQTVTRGAAVALDGSGSNDPDGDLLTYRWSLTSRPTGSAATLSSPDTATATFTADAEGLFVIELVVNDGFADSIADAVIVYVQKAQTVPMRNLTWRVVDAEYSKALDRIIMVSAAPSQLHVYDPVGASDVAVALPLTPTCVSVSPDGLYAAVGHNAWISYVNLATGVLEKTLAVTTDVLDIVLAGNGFVYAFPRIDQWERIRCVDIATGAETLQTGNMIYAGTRGRLHPNGSAIYGADNGLSPSDIEKYDIASGTAAYLYDSPYHGDYPMGGDLWFSEDGLRIFTRAGTVFRSSPLQSEDMTYNGALSDAGGRLQYVAHSSASGKVLAIPANGYYPYGETNRDTLLQIYDYAYLNYEGSLVLPSFDVAGTSYAGHGRYVFYDQSGGSFFVILQADAASGMLYDFAVAGY